MNVITRSSDDGVQVTVEVHGRFDINVYPQFNELIDGAESDTRFTVDLSNTEYLDSSALGMLLMMREKTGNLKEGVRIVGCCPEVRKVLDVANLCRLFVVD